MKISTFSGVLFLLLVAFLHPAATQPARDTNRVAAPEATAGLASNAANTTNAINAAPAPVEKPALDQTNPPPPATVANAASNVGTTPTPISVTNSVHSTAVNTMASKDSPDTVTNRAAVTPMAQPTATTTPAPSDAPLETSASQNAAPAVVATPEPRVTKRSTPQTELRDENAPQTVSPLWNVGAVVLTLAGLVVLFAFGTAFAEIQRLPLALGITTLGAATISQGLSAFGGALGTSLGLWLLCVCGFGGIALSGILDGNRNRASSGMLWLAAASALAQTLPHTPSFGAIPGILAAASMLGSLAFCAALVMMAAARGEMSGAPVDISAPDMDVTNIQVPPPAARARRSAKASQPVARLIGSEGTLKGQVYTLREGANSVGRDAAALDGNRLLLSGDDQVSRVHALIVCDAHRCTVMDAASAKGVFLNSARVLEERDLMNGDALQIGGTTFIYQRG